MFVFLAALDVVRKELVDKHATNVRKYEQKFRMVQQERQAVFQDAFQNDLNCYKEMGTIPSMYAVFFLNMRFFITYLDNCCSSIYYFLFKDNYIK